MVDRKKATDGIDHTEWNMYNPIFEHNVVEFDRALSREANIDSKYYVERRYVGANKFNSTQGASDVSGKQAQSFEDRMATNLFSGHTNPDTKLYHIIGNVGSGKTAFIQYMGTKKLPDKFCNVVFIHMNCYSRFADGATLMADFEVEFIRLVKLTLTSGKGDSLFSYTKFQDETKLAKEIYKSRGIENISDIEALDRLDRITPDIIIRFLVALPGLSRLLIAIDNIDDCGRDVRDMAVAFAERLSDYGKLTIKDSQIGFCVALPVRKYTFPSSNATEDYPKVDLPSLPVADILISKIANAADLIREKAKKIPGYVVADTPVVIEKPEGRSRIDIKESGKTLNIENIPDFLQLVIEAINSGEPKGLLNFIDSSSAGNLKRATRSMYNIFHSCKLPLSDLVTIVYSARDSLQYKDMIRRLGSKSLGPPIAYDLSMAIHTPFYDVRASRIVNIFNACNSRSQGDFHNTLSIIRFMSYIRNHKDKTLREIKAAMHNIGYSYDPYVKKAFGIALDGGLIDTEYGTEIKHFTDKSVINLSRSGEYYLNSVISDGRYLMYVADDIPMEDTYVVSVSKKYRKGEFLGDKRSLEKSVDNLIEFIAAEEVSELAYVTKKRNFDSGTLYRDFSLRDGGRPSSVSDIIRTSVARERAR